MSWTSPVPRDILVRCGSLCYSLSLVRHPNGHPRSVPRRCPRTIEDKDDARQRMKQARVWNREAFSYGIFQVTLSDQMNGSGLLWFNLDWIGPLPRTLYLSNPAPSSFRRLDYVATAGLFRPLQSVRGVPTKDDQETSRHPEAGGLVSPDPDR
jgi:hypothetical protein